MKKISVSVSYDEETKKKFITVVDTISTTVIFYFLCVLLRA